MDDLTAEILAAPQSLGGRITSNHRSTNNDDDETFEVVD